jgi:hypothetical protein
MNLSKPLVEQWHVEKLISYINADSIIKGRIQRKARWDMLPSKDNKNSNYYDYIQFLYKTQCSVDSITLALYFVDDKECYVNIDGNNRIKAVNHFYHHPLQIFKNNFLNLRVDSKYKLFVDFLENINYKILVGIRKIHRFILENASADIKDFWLTTFDEAWRLYVDEELEQCINTQLKIYKDYDFHTNVNINVVVFRQPTQEDLSFIFTSINKKCNPLSQTDILAATLFNADKFNLDFDPHLRADVEQALNDYYDGKNEGEILSSYTSATANKPMNGCEFLIAFQNRCSTKYGAHLLPPFDEKFEVMQRLFSNASLFYSLDAKAFTTDNIKHFVISMDKSLTVLQDINYQLHPPTVNLQKFKKSCEWKLTKNGLILLLTAIIKLQRLPTVTDNTVKQNIRKVLVYHLLLLDLNKNNTAYPLFNFHDVLGYKFGHIAKGLLDEPLTFGSEVTKERFTELLELLVKQENVGTTHKNKKKRGALTYTHRFLLSIYYNQRVPFNYTKRKQNVDHIVAYSSDWTDPLPVNDNGAINQNDVGLIDLDRIGNLIIMDEELNKGRGNGSIEYFYKKDEKLMACLDYPSLSTYNQIVKHTKKESRILDLKAYDKMAADLESKYVLTAVNYMFAS